MDKFDITVDSVAGYIKAILEINENMLNDKCHTAEVLLFRGQSDKRYELLPSIGRNDNLSKERNFIEMAKYKLPTLFSDNLSPVNLLALLQHHGIYTRLMDITSNPLVALYFACLSDNAGEVVVFKENQYDLANYPMANAIAESYKYIKGLTTDVIDFYSDIVDQFYFMEQKPNLERNQKSEEAKRDWIMSCCQNPCLFMHRNRV